MRVAVIGLGRQQPAERFSALLAGGPVLTRERKLSNAWLEGTGIQAQDLSHLFDGDDVEQIHSRLLAPFHVHQHEHDIVTYLVPDAGNIGDETVRLLGIDFGLELYPGVLDLDVGFSDVTVVDAYSVAVAETAYPFDAGQAKLSPQRDTVVTNFRGRSVRALASRRLTRTYGYIPDSTDSGALLYPAAVEPAETTAFEGLERIVAILRSPDGCPWDREQTIESLLPQLKEELAEFQAARETEGPEDQADELGDVLLHIVMISQIAREAGTFTMSNVIRSITAKMVRRHPHVFGNVEISDVEDLYRVWNEVKKQERLDKQRALGNGG
ncbi:MAG: MazG nucleotide pyrophosphohydrolase domain-containing protein [Thermomicrobiales bacterium]